MRQIGPLFGVSKSDADRDIDHIAPYLALAPPAARHPVGTVLIVDATTCPTNDATNADSQCPEQERKSSDPFHAAHAETEVVVGEKQSEGGDRCDSQQAGAPPQGGRYGFCQGEPRHGETDVACCHDEEGAQDMLVLIDVRRCQSGQHESHA